MTKDEIRSILEEKGIEFNKRWGVKRLEELLEQPKEVEPEITEEEIDKIAKAITEDKLSMARNIMGERVTPSGILIPEEVIAKWDKTTWQWVHTCSNEACHVHKVYRGRREYVRTYTPQDHGSDYHKLAEQITTKNNK